jgi:superfamily II DNA or RNA helicase/HKD family nuclease
MPRKLSPGLYDDLLNDALRALVDDVKAESDVDLDTLEGPDAPRYLADHARHLLERVLSAVPGNDEASQGRRVAIANGVLRAIADAADELSDRDLLDEGESRVLAPPERLVGVRPRDPLRQSVSMERPAIPLSQSAILMNAPGEPSLGGELRREMASADSVDLLCAFLKWSGLRLVLDRLEEVVKRGGHVRVLTTVYTGASDARAIEELAKLGAEVKISYETRRTRLHAKAWLFTRGSGANTAYVGSSNLSGAALHDGLEWNVRLSERDAAPLLAKFRAAFTSYWATDEFVPYDPTCDRPRVESALAAERTHGQAPVNLGVFDLRPHPYQQGILQALQVERDQGHHRNLVVAPTGTGKTLVAAFDYARLRRSLPRHRLLFIAHRERLLEQSRAAFAQVLRDSSFGEFLVGGQRPESGEHVFASIQSLARIPLASIDPTRFDVVIVDEFHHAEAKTYADLLQHLQPRILLGLTATPERHDGRDVRRWFGDRTAYEMRLWDALEQGLLAPFQYFGVRDDVDLTGVAWTRTGYDRAALAGLYTGNDARVRLVLQEIGRRIAEPQRMRALGFCVGVEHARFMAASFERAGLASVAVTGDDSYEKLEKAIADLERGTLQVIFTVDLFNEGVDIPSVDTVLFLRPTESATVFLQQLGRGLRLHSEKPCLTVLDFIGAAGSRFRFDRRFRALLGGTTRQIVAQIEGGFPYLPPGCAMSLERKAQDVVLGNIKQGIGSGKKWLTEELVAMGRQTTLSGFVEAASVDLVELYSNQRSFTSLGADAFGTPVLAPATRQLHARLGALLHVNDPDRMRVFQSFAVSEAPPRASTAAPRDRRLLHMLASAFIDRKPVDTLDDQVRSLWHEPTLRTELQALLAILDDRRREPTTPWVDPRQIRPVPLHVHGRYRQEEVLAGIEVLRKGVLPRIQTGVFYVEEHNIDLLFVTLRKTEASFSPSTMYKDYAISPTRFHWESQNSAHPTSETGQRYLARSSTVLLFVREEQRQANGLAAPFVFLGNAKLVECSGQRPMQIVWELETAMPVGMYQRATLAAG